MVPAILNQVTSRFDRAAIIGWFCFKIICRYVYRTQTAQDTLCTYIFWNINMNWNAQKRMSMWPIYRTKSKVLLVNIFCWNIQANIPAENNQFVCISSPLTMNSKSKVVLCVITNCDYGRHIIYLIRSEKHDAQARFVCVLYQPVPQIFHDELR